MGVVYYQRLRHMVADKFQVSESESHLNINIINGIIVSLGANDEIFLCVIVMNGSRQ